MTARLIRFGFFAVLLALFTAEGAVAQDRAAPPPADGMTEGVVVHGHWTITVAREGEVVERREFENALVSEGTTHLALLLSRQRSPGPWTIILNTVEGPTVGLCVNDTNPGQCTINEDDTELTASAEPDGSGGTQVVLEGSDMAQTDGSIRAVSTSQDSCSPDTSPIACLGGQIIFTRHNLDSFIPVQNGDQIEVTVELSFN